MAMAPPVTNDAVMSIADWPTNGHLIASCAQLGYLRPEWRTLDPTYGLGTFWTVWSPSELVAHDLVPAKSPTGESVDFRCLPYTGRSFDAVVFDPPYKLNGTPSDTDGVDERYGVAGEPVRWQDRMGLIAQGVIECARVLDKGYLLVKCQDQVSSGKVRWQTTLVKDAAAMVGLGYVDRFDYLGGRAQDEERGQKHARHNSSQLLVFKRGW